MGRLSPKPQQTEPLGESSSSTRQTLFIGLGLALITLALYVRAASFDYINWDDLAFVAQNPHVTTGLRGENIVWAFTTDEGGNWEPLAWISHMMDAQIFGQRAGGHHLTSVLLHVLNTVLVFLVLYRLTGREWPSAVVAALFAIHPLRVESVAWVAERKDVLSAFFFLLAIGSYQRYAERPSVGRYLVVAVWFLFGLASKPMVVTLPFVLLLLDYWPLRRMVNIRALSRLAIEKLPMLFLSAIIIKVTFASQRGGGFHVIEEHYPILNRVGHVVLCYAHGLENLFWPTKLVLPYPLSKTVDSREALAAVAVLAIVSLAATLSARRWPYFIVGWLWFLGMLVPVIALVQYEAQTMADRFMYLPAIGVFIAVAWGASDLRDWLRLPRYLVAILAAVVLVLSGWLTSNQLSYWKDSEALFSHTIAVYPQATVARANLAKAYAMQNRYTEAVKCAEELVRLNPEHAGAHLLLAQFLAETNETHQAVAQYEITIKCNDTPGSPNIAIALNNLAWIRATSTDDTLRNGSEAVQLAKLACKLMEPQFPDPFDTLAAALAEAGDFDGAVQAATRAIELAHAAKNGQSATQIGERLQLYQRRQPFRTATQ
jgi:tetratricopeptide (TPR) repeat protein